MSITQYENEEVGNAKYVASKEYLMTSPGSFWMGVVVDRNL